MYLVAAVGDVRVALVHGDLESLAGWSLSQETLASEENKNIVLNQILTSQCAIVASSHTCLPIALMLDTDQGPRAVFNNGAAGMPNFAGTHYGVITRVSTQPCQAHPTLYGTRIANSHVDAVAVNYDKLGWHDEFLRQWPTGSAAYQSYYHRISAGPNYPLAQAARL